MASKIFSSSTEPTTQQEWTDALQAGLEARNAQIDPAAIRAVGQYFFLLDQSNQTTNLTAYKALDDWIDFHLLDTVAMLKTHPIADGASVIDIGSGAGIPGLLFACLQPTLSVTLVESVGKKARFIQDCIETMGLAGCRAVSRRAEEMAYDEAFRSRYQVATARALAGFAMALELCASFVVEDGIVLLPRAEQEAEPDRFGEALGVSLQGVEAYQLPRRDHPFFLYVYRKDDPGDAKYPRRANQMKNKPL